MTEKIKNYMRAMQDTSPLSGGNNLFVESLYEEYLANPTSVPAGWRSYFDALQAGAVVHDVAHSPIQRAFAALPKRAAEVAAVDESLERKQVFVLQMISAYRFLVARIANLYPLSRHAKPEVPELNPAHYGFTNDDMDITFETGSLVSAARMTLREILQLLRQTYCSSIGS